MTTPVFLEAGTTSPDAPLVVLFHGRGSNEREILGLSAHLPQSLRYVAVRGPVAVGPDNYAWFENQGIGRPIPASLRSTMDWFSDWLDQYNAPATPVALVGFSGGAAFVGGLTLDRPAAFTGSAVLYGTIPFDAGVPTTPNRLAGARIFHARAQNDAVMPPDLMAKTWTYLTEQSGATLSTAESTAGHAMTEEVVSQLGTWLDRSFAG